MPNAPLELLWLFTNMGAPQKSPIILHCHNHNAIQIVHNDIFHKRTKHIENDCHFVRHHFQSNTPSPPPTNLQISSPKLFILLVSLSYFTNPMWFLLYHLEFEGDYYHN